MDRCRKRAEHILLARQVGVPAIVVFLNKLRMVKTQKCWSWWNWKYGNCVRSLPVSWRQYCHRAWLGAAGLNGDAKYEKAIDELIGTVTKNVPATGAGH